MDIAAEPIIALICVILNGKAGKLWLYWKMASTIKAADKITQAIMDITITGIGFLWFLVTIWFKPAINLSWFGLSNWISREGCQTPKINLINKKEAITKYTIPWPVIQYLIEKVILFESNRYPFSSCSSNKIQLKLAILGNQTKKNYNIHEYMNMTIGFAPNSYFVFFSRNDICMNNFQQ